MNYRVVDKNNKKYIECISSIIPLHNEQAALDLIALCGENDTNLLMINAEALARDFFDLKTGLAGQILQKFANYYIKAAVVVSNEMKIKGKFKEMMIESNRGNNFRIFNNQNEAENWLLG